MRSPCELSVELPPSMRVLYRHERRNHCLYRVAYPNDEPTSIDDIVRRLPNGVKVSVHRPTCAQCDDGLQLQLYVPKYTLDGVARKNSTVTTLTDFAMTCAWLALSWIVAADMYMCFNRISIEVV
ncbi:hypothetical protein CYMTET_35666 [Cymbomonas tetramitiformis]|uniref:Uncharacterized protein n=1 Tax=Cymbomonas tetramitiformis TaxID=36881 RepID=A0AAE0F8V1_9CHLO|nr:hypothetical protein CYMTET_35666 [Cymbomonas tetramitiformis]|eukprot:gene308-567_t